MMKQFKDRNFLEKYNKFVFFYDGVLSNWAQTPQVLTALREDLLEN